MITKEQEQTVIEMFQDKLPVRYICKTLRLSIATVYKILNNAGLRDKYVYEDIASKTGYAPIGMTKEEWIQQAKERVRRLKEPRQTMSIIDAVNYSFIRNRINERRHEA